MKHNGVSKIIYEKLKHYETHYFINEENWQKVLARLNISCKQTQRKVTEAILIGILIQRGFPKNMAIISDDAGQFNVFKHALCWIHAERGITKLFPQGQHQIKALEWARSQTWDIYHLLLGYKVSPDKTLKAKIKQAFKAFVTTATKFPMLNKSLKVFNRNKNELLRILDYPDIALHNNLSERDIR